MKIDSFKNLFAILLEDIYFLQNQNLLLYPLLIEKADSLELKDALQTHLIESRQHLQKIEYIFKALEMIPQQTEQENPIKSLYDHTTQFLNENTQSPLLDAAIIAIIQKIEHIEMATYGTLKEYAEVIDLTNGVKFLEECLKETVKTDMILNRLAKGKFFTIGINLEAAKM